MLPSWVEYDPADFDTVYEVGPGQDFADPNEVPWESLEGSTLVRIHPAESAYAVKFALATDATEEAPLVVTGVPDDDGTLPRLTGVDALTRTELDYWNEDRSLRKIGGTSHASGVTPRHVVVQGLDLSGAHADHDFTDDAGNPATYTENAACIHIEDAEFVTVRANVLHGCGNGLFVGGTTSDLLVVANHLYENGNIGSAYEHNSYTESDDIAFWFNRYGPLCEGCDGNNLKDRSARLTVACNYLEGGNRKLDLVDGSEDVPDGGVAQVFGNVLHEPDDDGNSQIVHWGGDSGSESAYRTTLYFSHNTVVSQRSGNTTLFRLSTADQVLIATNNVFHAENGSLALTAGTGQITLTDNWLDEGWVDTFEESFAGTIEASGALEGDDPGFASLDDGDFTPVAGSPLLGAAGALPDEALPVTCAYVRHQQGLGRPDTSDLGALQATGR